MDSAATIELDARPDHAEDLGPAFQARPSSIEPVGGEWRGSRKTGAVLARVCRDATLHDALHDKGRITDTQHKAASMLHSLFHGGGLSPRICARYNEWVSPGGGGGSGDDEPSSTDEYRAVLRGMPMSLAVRIDAMVLQDWRESDLLKLREALDHVAGEWGL